MSELDKWFSKMSKCCRCEALDSRINDYVEEIEGLEEMVKKMQEIKQKEIDALQEEVDAAVALLTCIVDNYPEIGATLNAFRDKLIKEVKEE